VSIGGREISTCAESDRARWRRREIGFVFQSDNLLPFLTATENVSLQCSLAGAGDSDGDARSLELLARLGLAEEAAKFPDQLSGGQRQRVAVARALIHQPSLIVADEPTGSLDAGNAEAVVDLLLGAQRTSAATLVLVTHEPAVARRLDRAVGMRDGRLTDRMDPVDPGSPSPTPNPSHA
jgi:putative ABC transport system ATP-binding protein